MKMHADELDIDVELVRTLVAEQFPEWADLPVVPVEPRGTDNALYRLGESMVVRLPRQPGKVRPLAKEHEWLPRLAPHLPLDVPLPLVQGVPSEGFPLAWSIFSWLDGEPVTQAPIADLNEGARELAGFIAALQRIDTVGAPAPGDHNAARGVPLERRDPMTRAAIAALEGTIDTAAVSAEWERALAAPAWEGPPLWLHGDLDARNLLVRDGRLSGVVDFGCLGVGDPAYDVMAAWKLFAGESREVFRACLAVDDATWTRSRGLAVSQAVMALSYYTPATNAVLYAEAGRWVAEVLGSPS
jgi:aminoglycoside phosphotransferase (APT) family kinase protein